MNTVKSCLLKVILDTHPTFHKHSFEQLKYETRQSFIATQGRLFLSSIYLLCVPSRQHQAENVASPENHISKSNTFDTESAHTEQSKQYFLTGQRGCQSAEKCHVVGEAHTASGLNF